MSTKSRSDEAYAFPAVDQADEQGFLAYGGDLSPERLISAYESGIFPWYEEGQPILWWSPPQRMVLYPDNFRVSRSLKQTLRSGKFEIRIDTAFERVIEACAAIERDGQAGTWITPEMVQAYKHLHHLGFAHSFECYAENELVGGLYGLSLGKTFFGESMFSRTNDASKVAFSALVSFAKKEGFSFIDCQLYTEHLASLGAVEMPRAQFQQELKSALAAEYLIGNWTSHA
ncbi:MAG: leucyl/phenylalanyl-tRNA--protein transferase [Flavobacteriales bacterium]|nr:leucyl/phenylalanyl-tRNA--protein transferase [Flavobacteriales bacterium]